MIPLITSSFGKPCCVEKSISRLWAIKWACSCCSSWGFCCELEWGQACIQCKVPKTHTFQTKNHQLWKQNIWGNSSQGASCQQKKKKLFSVYVELFAFLVSLCGWPRVGQVNAASWVAVAASSWVTEQTLGSIHEPPPGLCCRVGLHPNIAELIPMDPTLYPWKAFSPPIIPLAGWVPSTICASRIPAGTTPVPDISVQTFVVSSSPAHLKFSAQVSATPSTYLQSKRRC